MTRTKRLRAGLLAAFALLTVSLSACGGGTLEIDTDSGDKKKERKKDDDDRRKKRD